MRFEHFVLRATTAVDWTLRRLFPENFNLRCPYVACGMHHLARREGLSSAITAGEFSCKVFPVGGREPWDRSFDANLIEYAHHWNEIEGHLVDPGFRYASKRNTPPTYEAPIAMWPLDKPLPGWMGYRVQRRWHEIRSSILAEEYPGAARDDLLEYLGLVERKYDRIRSGLLDSWVLSGRARMVHRSERGDRWSRLMLNHEKFTSDKRRGIPVRREIVAQSPVIAPAAELNLDQPGIIAVAPTGFQWVDYYDAPEVAGTDRENALIAHVLPGAVVPDSPQPESDIGPQVRSADAD